MRISAIIVNDNMNINLFILPGDKRPLLLFCHEIGLNEGEKYKALRERVAKNMQGDNTEGVVL